MLILAGIGFYSCDDITKGYLETGEAGYVTDTLRIALAPDSHYLLFSPVRPKARRRS